MSAICVNHKTGAASLQSDLARQQSSSGSVVLTNLPRKHFGAILADPPWHFEVWSLDNTGRAKHPSQHYQTMPFNEICALPVRELAADDCVLFLWITWPMLEHAIECIGAWGFTYKTCGFLWAKAHANQLEMFQDHIDAHMGLGYWTRANSEPCLLATRGKPKRKNADVRQTIIEPRREHSRKPDCIYERIERLVDGPYLELFARQCRPGWHAWGNEVEKFTNTSIEGAEYDRDDDLSRSIEEAYRHIRARKAAGGKGWPE